MLEFIANISSQQKYIILSYLHQIEPRGQTNDTAIITNHNNIISRPQLLQMASPLILAPALYVLATRFLLSNTIRQLDA
jgi:hypothetical protein